MSVGPVNIKVSLYPTKKKTQKVQLLTSSSSKSRNSINGYSMVGELSDSALRPGLDCRTRSRSATAASQLSGFEKRRGVTKLGSLR